MRGTLGLLDLVDLLQLLSRNASRGCLAITHPSGHEARVFMRDGRVVHASFGASRDLDAIRVLIADQRGSFEFLPGVAPAAETVQVGLESLLFAAIRSLNTTEETVHIGRLPEAAEAPYWVEHGRVSELDLTPDDERLERLVDGKRNLAEIAALGGVPLKTAQRLFGRLVSLGLASTRKPSIRVARLAVALGRSQAAGVAVLDREIIDAWRAQTAGEAARVRLVGPDGQTCVLEARGEAGVGPQVRLSSVALVRFNLKPGQLMTATPDA